MKLLTAIIACLLLASCAAIKQRKAERFFDNNPGKAAEYLNKRYPATTTIDSSGYKQSMRELDSMLNGLPEVITAKNFDSANEGVPIEPMYKPQRIGIGDPDNSSKKLDIYQGGGKSVPLDNCTKQIAAYKAQLAQIRQYALNLKPVIIKVPDSVGKAALLYRIAELEKENAVLKADNGRLQDGRNDWRKWALWTWIGLAVLIALYIISRRVVPVKL